MCTLNLALYKSFICCVMLRMHNWRTCCVTSNAEIYITFITIVTLITSLPALLEELGYSSWRKLIKITFLIWTKLLFIFTAVVWSIVFVLEHFINFILFIYNLTEFWYKRWWIESTSSLLENQTSITMKFQLTIAVVVSIHVYSDG